MRQPVVMARWGRSAALLSGLLALAGARERVLVGVVLGEDNHTAAQRPFNPQGLRPKLRRDLHTHLLVGAVARIDAPRTSDQEQWATEQAVVSITAAAEAAASPVRVGASRLALASGNTPTPRSLPRSPPSPPPGVPRGIARVQCPRGTRCGVLQGA